MARQQAKLSASLEDYLEAIYNLSNSGTAARSKDIADNLNVATSSVTGALKTLAERNLVNYKPYGHITLTAKGRVIAADVAKKHDVIKSFFVDILGVEEKLAQNAACDAEHSLGHEITNRLLDFIEFVTGHDDDGVDFPAQFRKFCTERNAASSKEKHSKLLGKPLSNIPSGQTVNLLGVHAGTELKSRLAAMGMIPNASITVISNNPTGPFVISVKGSKIILGRSMVHKVIVK